MVRCAPAVVIAASLVMARVSRLDITTWKSGGVPWKQATTNKRRKTDPDSYTISSGLASGSVPVSHECLISFETGRKRQTQSCWTILRQPMEVWYSIVNSNWPNYRSNGSSPDLPAYQTSLTMSALSNPFWTDFSFPLRRVVFVALAGHWRPRLVCNLSVGFDPTQTSLRSNFDHDYFFKLPLRGAGCPIKWTAFYFTPCPVPSCPACEPNSNDGE